MQTERLISEKIAEDVRIALAAKGIETYGNNIWQELGIEEVAT